MNSLKQIIKKLDLIKIVEILVVVMMFVIPVVTVHAQLNRNFQCDPSSGLNCSSTDVNSFIRLVINWLLGIAFGVAVLFLIIGGFWYITSAGNEETAEKGKGTAINAIIGIVIIILSYVIINVVAGLVSKPAGP